MSFRLQAVRTLLACTILMITWSARAADLEQPLKRLDLGEGDQLVFLGDSITHQCLYTQYVEDYFYTRFPQTRIKFHNAGVGGAKAWDALERFDRDVAAYKPKYVTVLLGMNDGTYKPYSEEVFGTYRRDMTTLIGRIRDAGAVPILMTPTMYDARAARLGSRKTPPETIELYNSVLAYFGTWLRDVAVESGYGFVDMHSLLNNLTLARRKDQPDFTMIRDAVHPGPAGQAVMAYALLSDLGTPRLVSRVQIVQAGGDTPDGRATGGTISALKKTETSIEFTWLAESLPWVVPKEAQEGARLVKLGHRMSKESLAIHGLPAGRYKLTIDGQSVGKFGSAALARRIELQNNSETPQYQQAAEVAELNQKRNSGPVRSLRNLWRDFQSYSRLRAQNAASPDDKKLAERVTAAYEKLGDMEERIAEYEAAAREIEDQIFEINQPRPRKYVLTRIKGSEDSARRQRGRKRIDQREKAVSGAAATSTKGG
jgi:lysophospholipase L1-like esterase